MGKGSAKQNVDEFYMAIHLGLGWGPMDAITGLYVGEKLAWQGEQTVEGSVYVNAPSLFGGPKEEGGVGGIMYYLPGGRNQVMPNNLAQRYGLTSNTSPAYRGTASVFFIGTTTYPAGTVNTGGTSGAGGSTAGGGGSGEVGGDGNSGGSGGGGSGSCVWTDAWLPDGRRAGDVEAGDTMTVLDLSTMAGTRESVVRSSSVMHDQPCVTLVTFSGITKTVSMSTPFTTDTGRTISVMDCCGYMAPVTDGTGFRWERITDVLDAGRRSVMLIDLGGETFFGGDDESGFIATHNKLSQNEAIP